MPNTASPPNPKLWQRSRIWLRDLLLFALIFYGVLWWQTKDMLSASGDVQINPLTLVSLEGSVHTVAPDHQRATLLYFFAPWCSVCEATIGHLDDVDPQRYNIVVIALDYDNTNDVADFIDRTGLSKAVYLGTRELREAFQVKGYPTFYILDPDFRVIDKSMGYATVLELKIKG
jgi:thiol-disulfide isomerase/thioredoxin